MGLVLKDELPLPHSICQFCGLLSVFDGGLAPTTLLYRGCTDQPMWSQIGEIARRRPNEVLVPKWLMPLFNSESGLSVEVQQAIERGAVRLERQGSSQYIRLCNDWRDIVQFQALGLGAVHTSLDVLAVIMHAFPEPYADLVWEETQYQLWGVVESTCFSLLSVLGERDLLEYLASKPGDARGRYLTHLLMFLLRISSLLPTNGPVWVFPLTSMVLRLIKTEPSVSQSEVQGLELQVHLKDIIYQFKSSNKEATDVIEQIKSLDYRLDERSNAAVGLAISALPPRTKSTLLFDQLDCDRWFWAPISNEKPSPLEVIIWMKLFRYMGKLGCPLLPYFGNFDNATQALIAFDLVRDGKPQEAREILERVIPAIHESQGTASLEYIVTTTELINCCNLLSAEETGERYAQNALSRVPHSFSSGTFGLHNLVLSYVDSLIGLARYTEAEALLLDILHEPSTASDVATKAALRMLKARRRQKNAWHNDHTRFSLKVVVNNFLLGSNALRAHCVEEILCNMLLVDRKDAFQLRVANAVIVDLQAQLASTEGCWYANDIMLSWHTETLAKYGSICKERISVMDARSHRKQVTNLKTRTVSNSSKPTAASTTTLMDIYRMTSWTIQTVMSLPILESGKTAWNITRSGIGLIDLAWTTSKWQELAMTLLLGADLRVPSSAMKIAAISERGQIVLTPSEPPTPEEASTRFPASMSDRRASLIVQIEPGSRSFDFKKGRCRPKWQGIGERELNREFAFFSYQNSRRREKATDRVSSDRMGFFGSMGFRTLFLKARIVLRHYRGF